MRIVFNQDFIIPRAIQDAVIITDTLGIREDSRILKEEIDLSHFIKFYLIQGSNDSAPINEFDYETELTGFTARSMILKFTFAYPLSISTGTQPDKFRLNILEPDLFISKDSGKTIEQGTVLEVNIPRQFPSSNEFNFIQVTSTTVEAATSTAGFTLILLSLVMAASLKTMWNVMNMM